MRATGDETSAKTKVAILGGGPASLAAAYQLTEKERDAYDITIYEMSWRLGGKTASGRDGNGRIEEHGLHVLFGGYHNAFDMMLNCYDEVRKECGPDTLMWSSFFDALEPGDFGVIGDDRYDPWQQDDLQFPVNRGVPGDAPLPTIWDLGSEAFQVFLHVIGGAGLLRALQKIWGRLMGYRRRFPRAGRPRARDIRGDGGGWFMRKVVIPAVLHLLDLERWAGRMFHALIRAVHRVVRLIGPLARLKGVRRGPIGRAWTAADLVLATLKGLAADRVLFRDDGFQRLDRFDLRVWLKQHGTHWHTRYSPLVRIIYDAAFSYPNGGRRAAEGGFLRERMAAGTALRIIMWMAFTYKGSMYYKMRAGMGDVISTPLYRLLKKRGVKFKFFHKVKRLARGKDENGREVISRVDLEVLARPARAPAQGRESDGDEYDPLIRVGELDCWPSAPIPERIHPDDRQDAAKAEEFFHHMGTRGSAERRLVLERRQSGGALSSASHSGETFDKVIFGIPVGCIPYLCEDLEARGNWGKQAKVSSTQTVAFQVWSKFSLPELGWTDPRPLLSLFWDPLNTWSDMNQVLPQEGWREEQRPAMVAYFCGPLPHEWPHDERERLEPAGEAAFRRYVEAQVKQARQGLLDRLHELWPLVGAAAAPGIAGKPGVSTPPRAARPKVFNWNVLHDPENRHGEARLQAQYLRANVDPHARCTLALPRESENRIDAQDTGYANLTVAGDWTANHILAACFEGAVQSGIRAARAVSDQPYLYRIIGERLLDNPAKGLGYGRTERSPPPASPSGDSSPGLPAFHPPPRPLNIDTADRGASGEASAPPVDRPPPG